MMSDNLYEFDPNAEYPPPPLRVAHLRRNRVKSGRPLRPRRDIEFQPSPLSRVIPPIPSSSGKKYGPSDVDRAKNIPTALTPKYDVLPDIQTDTFTGDKQLADIKQKLDSPRQFSQEYTVSDCDIGRYIEDEKLCTIDRTLKGLLHTTSDNVMEDLSDMEIYARLNSEWQKMKTIYTQASLIIEKAHKQFVALKQHYVQWAEKWENSRDKNTEAMAKPVVLRKVSRLPVSVVTKTTAATSKPSRLPLPVMPSAAPNMAAPNNCYLAEKTEITTPTAVPKLQNKVKRGKRFFTDLRNNKISPIC